MRAIPEADHEQEVRVVRRVLALLRGPAPASGQPRAPRSRVYPVPRRWRPGRPGLPGLAPRHARGRLRLRLDRSFLLRAEQAGHLHASALVLPGGRPDVPADVARADGTGDPTLLGAVPHR